MSQFRKMIFLIVAGFFCLLFVQNVGMLSARLPFNFFTYEPVQMMAGYWFVIFISFGLMIGSFFSMRSYWIHQKNIKALKAEIKHLNEELAKHRTLILNEDSEDSEANQTQVDNQPQEA